MDDRHVDDELEIMSERSQSIRVELNLDAFEHPLTVLVKRPVVTVSQSTSVGSAIALMRERRTGAVAVTEQGKLVGIFTERDFMMKAGTEGDKVRDRPVSELMTPDPDFLMPDDDVKFVINRMHVGGYRHIPVVNDAGEPVHLISMRDVLGFLLDHFPKLVTNIPPRPSRGAPPWGG